MNYDSDLEEIILYLNANEPTGKYCKNIENLKNKLQRLEEIDNAEPSEALECIEKLYKERAYTYDDKVNNKGKGWNEAIKHYDNIGRCLNTIKQALLNKKVEVHNSKALECLKRLDYMEFHRSIETYVPSIDGDISETQYLCNTDEFAIIQQALTTKSKKELAFDEFNEYITNLYKHRNNYEKKMLYEFEIDNAVIRASTIEELYNKFKEVMKDDTL